MMRESDGRIGKASRLGLLLHTGCSALAIGCETRVIAAKGIGTARYLIQPFLEGGIPSAPGLRETARTQRA